MAEVLAPPPYEEKPPDPVSIGIPQVPHNSEPSAPPPNFGTPYEQIQEATDAARPPLSRAAGGGRCAPVGQQAQQTTINKLINRYASYSLPRQMRKYVEPRHERQDPELDVEAHLSRGAVRNAQKALERKKRLRHISAWLWCFGCILIPFYIGLPIIMIVIGVVGIGECYAGEIVGYLIGGGIVLAILVVVRVVPSFLICMRLRNYLMSRTSNKSARVICTLEGIFYIVLVINFIFLIFGTYTTFVNSKPPSCTESPSGVPAPNCCDPFVFVSSAVFTVLQYVLYVVTGVFVFLVVCCLRSRSTDVEDRDGTDM